MGPWFSTIYEILRTAHASNMPDDLKEELKKSCKTLSEQIVNIMEKTSETERENCAKLCEMLGSDLCSKQIRNQPKMKII